MVLLQIIMKLKWCFNNYFVYRDNLNGVITLSGVLGFGWQLKWCYEDFSKNKTHKTETVKETGNGNHSYLCRTLFMNVVLLLRSK